MSDEQQDGMLAALQQATDAALEHAGNPDQFAALVERYWSDVQERASDPDLSEAARSRILELADARYLALLAEPAAAESALAIDVLSGTTDDPLTASERFLRNAVPEQFLAPAEPESEESIELPDGQTLHGDDAAEFASSVLQGLKRWPMQHLGQDGAVEGGAVIDGHFLTDVEMGAMLQAAGKPTRERTWSDVMADQSGDDGEA